MDDLNTPRAFSVLKSLKKERRNQELGAALQMLGLPILKSSTGNASAMGSAAAIGQALGGKLELGKKIDTLIILRLEARRAKNWAESDRIRDELAAMGIAIKDNKDGTTSWEVKR